jgi:predicted nucleic acid-binding protein
MSVLVDTSVLGRLANKLDPSHGSAQASVAKLRGLGETLHITPQNLIEFRNFATRPVAANGLGLTPVEAAKLSASFEAMFSMSNETPAIYRAWRNLVDTLGAIGKQVHDARLVAVCHVHNVDKVLTFNVAHFARFAAAPPGIVVIDAAAP